MSKKPGNKKRFQVSKILFLDDQFAVLSDTKLLTNASIDVSA